MKRWDSLTMKDKAKLIQLFVINGITKLGEMKNLYEEGGDVPSLRSYKYSTMEDAPASTYRWLTSKTRDLDSLIEKDLAFREKRRDVDEKYFIPYNKEKRIKLTGEKTDKLRGSVTSTNVLDTLAKYGAKAGQDPTIVLGMAGNETNFGMYPERYMLPEDYDNALNFLEFNEGLTPAQLVNNDRYYASPYNDALAEVARKAGAIGEKHADARISYVSTDAYTDSLANIYAKQGMKYADKLASQTNMEEHPLVHAFKTYFDQYNQGDSGYKERLIKWGKMAFSSPEIQKWWKDSGRAYYEQYAPEILKIFENNQ